MASKIEVNLDTSINNKISVQCKQSDDLILQANIFEKGIEKDITNYNVIINGRKADYTFVIQNTDIVKENNKMVVQLDRDFSRVPGTTKVDITLLKDGKQDTTFEFDLEVVANVIRGSVEHGNKIPILEELQNTVAEAKESNEEAKQLKLEVTEIKEETEKMIPAASQVKEDLNILIPEATPIRDDLKQLIPEAGEINNLIRQQIAEHKVNEEKREAAEEDRVIKEVSRENAESIRANSENTRKENENLRKSNEETRISNENARVTNEEDRKTKENERLENEKTRVLSETTREENETDRVLNEKTRVSKENERIENETNRVKSESDRVTAENDRVSNETERKSNEQKRVSAEEEREANEIARQAAYKEIQDARTDYFGIEHNNLEERLNEDFDNIHQRVNESSLLPYEGTNITADNSYYGLIKDLTIKGKTLQNLWSSPNKFTIIKDGLNSVTSLRKVALKANTEYTFIFNIPEVSYSYTIGFIFCISYADGSTTYDKTLDSLTTGIKVFKTTTANKEVTGFGLGIHNLNSDGSKVTFENVMILEGDYTNTPLSELPFFEGIKSVGENEVTEDGKYKLKVKSCGKNLISFSNNVSWGINGKPDIVTMIDDNSFVLNGTLNGHAFFNVTLKEGQYISSGGDYIVHSLMPGDSYFNGRKFTFTSTTTFVCYIPSGTYNNETIQLQIEEGTVGTDYEPYKEQLIEYLLDEPHMSLPNGTEDIIDEDGILTKRIGKVVLDGSENWQPWVTTFTNVIAFKVAMGVIKNNSAMLCDKFVVDNSKASSSIDDSEYIGKPNGSLMHLKILKTKLSTQDVAGFKAWLSQNPVTVYYELATPITTQLEKPQLFSQDGTTHIFSDNLLPPKISCKIASNVPAVISYLRLENEALQKENTDLLEQVEENNIINIETSLEQDARLTMLELGVN